MRKLLALPLSFLFILNFITGCSELKTVSTNNTGGLFSLNGTWQLSSSTDNNAMVGTTITVYPVLGNATIRAISNNTYCAAEKGELWRSIKSNTAGGFTLSNLVSNCNGTITYKDATISIVNNDEITVNTRTAGNSELIQAWKRIKKQ